MAGLGERERERDQVLWTWGPLFGKGALAGCDFACAELMTAAAGPFRAFRFASDSYFASRKW